uniref:Aromatic ring-hydroxylating dioxygenase subunit alpha n=1 Tax=Anaerolinea thermolimosa TaxID=229919 RepID=A0A7C4PMG2_9CHLR
MIRNQWYVVLESNEVRAGRPVGVTRLGEKLAFWRTRDGKVVCLKDRCVHLGASLCQGKISSDDRLACPFHAFEYDASGQCRYIPSLGRNAVPPRAMRVDSYLTHEAHGLIWIFWGEAEKAMRPPRFFDLDDGFTYAGYRDPWSVHYSRMVENQMDVMHLPHVHYNTIGRGRRVVVDGPVVTLEEDTLRMWVYNRLDDGTPPRKPEELPEPNRPPFLEFIFPNIWQNRISDDMRIFVAFVPVDEENGILYLRYYQRIVRLPVLRTLFNWVGIIGSRYIANQDKRVVSQQVPKKTSLRNGEKFVQGDRIILAYRRRREELLRENGQLAD